MKASYSPEQVDALFQGSTEKWWIAGGWAIDMFLGEQTREHDDIDIAILRKDERAFRTRLQDWELWLGLGDGLLEAKPIALGEELSAEREVLWCRPSSDAEWAFELLLNPSESDEWLFKRDSRVRMPLTQLGKVSKEGIPYLAPEVILLFKAKNNRERDQLDFEQAISLLSYDAREWLRDSLLLVHPMHPWLDRL